MRQGQGPPAGAARGAPSEPGGRAVAGGVAGGGPDDGRPEGAVADAPVPGAVPDDDGPPSRGAAAVTYMVCIAVAIGFILGPLAAFIIWRMRRHEAFVDFHGRQALDLFLTALLVGGGLYVVGRLALARSETLGAAMQWFAIAVAAVQAGLMAWGAVMALRTQQVAIPLSLRLFRRPPPV